MMANLYKLSLPELSTLEKTFDSVYLTPDTYKVSKLASGCLLQVFTQINFITNNAIMNKIKI